MDRAEWRPHKRQEIFLRSPAREILFGGARGGGKTDAGIIWVARPAIEHKHSRFRGLVLRETAASLADWVDRAEEIYGKTGGRLVQTPTPHFIWPWGAKIFTGHLKDARSISRFLGREFQRILVEELTQIGEKDLYDKLLGSCRSTIPGLDSRLAATTNPGGPGHYWVKKRFVDPVVPGTIFREEGTSLTRQFIPSLVTDNPTLCLNDPAYVEYLDSLPEKLKKAWRYGDWSILEGSYFTEFTRRTHVIRPFDIPHSWAKYRSIDWGYWPDPCVCSWFAVSPDKHRRREVLYRDRHWFRTVPEDVAKDILFIDKEQSIVHTVADPSMWAVKSGVSDAELMIMAGLSMLRADNSRIPGWTRMHESLQMRNESRVKGEKVMSPEMKIFDTCTKSIEAIEIAQHDKKNPMDIADNKLDHWIDTIRYHCMGRASKGRMKDIIPDINSLKAMRYRKERYDGYE
jgi:phage terminase large subunit